MFGIGKLKFKGVDKKYISDEAHAQDYKATKPIGRVRLGELCFYYRDLGKKYYAEYDYITRTYVKEHIVQPDDSPAIAYYRLILIHGEAEFAGLLFEKEEEVNNILTWLRENRPEVKIGYVAPPSGKKV